MIMTDITVWVQATTDAERECAGLHQVHVSAGAAMLTQQHCSRTATAHRLELRHDEYRDQEELVLVRAHEVGERPVPRMRRRHRVIQGHADPVRLLGDLHAGLNE